MARPGATSFVMSTRDHTNDLVEAAHAEVMRRVLVPVHEAGVPDPGVDFEACCDAILERVHREVCALPADKRSEYFLEKARAHLSWALANRAPDVLITRLRAWLGTLAH